MKSRRELQLEEVLIDLLRTHFYSRELEWSWVEGTTLLDHDPDIYRKINMLLPEIINEKDE